ncbi:FkbM family methyltransferase [Cecembia lonarensis]|uniref:Methyltransferase, FkbM family n=1 Tax=Cecembia lonarensis (strain CCUG 58316 / KCTC 22772 / LW9) TaxID=1225176 RepID=K1LEK1_CECL9|nr:FkbM family methyltransferase [Cecembia lonarensis]EKB50607.1 methyltransferase, FkbM family [Cecembia lonarensis LW9]
MSLKYFFKKKYNQFRFDLCASENPLYLGFYKYLYKPPKGTLSDFLDQYSKENSPVTFLQIGANDGFIYDPLQKFIKRDNWQGVMLEPQPHVFNTFLTKIHAKRPAIIPVNAALSHKDGKTILYTIGFSKERWATGLSSFDKEVLMQKFRDGTIFKKAAKQGISVPENEKDWIEELEIHTMASSTLLEKFQGKKIDLLAVDTEGFDFEILKMLPLDKMNPKVIIYEEEHFDMDTKNACQSHLESLGYTYHQAGRDVYATKGLDFK